MKTLKKFLSLVLVSLMVIQLAACAASEKPTTEEAASDTAAASEAASSTTDPSSTEVSYKAGTYKSKQQGHNGFVEYEVTFSENAITDINVVKGYETLWVSDKAIKTELPEAIIKHQSLDVDSITGATISSAATKRAVEDCVEQAGGDPELLKGNLEKAETTEVVKDADIIVVGGGGAGLAAAVAAAQAGKTVVVVEKAGYVGGNTVVSGGIYNAPDEELQKKKEMTPGLERLITDAIEEESISEEHAALQAKVKEEFEAYKASGATYEFDSVNWFTLQTWNGGDKVGDLKLVNILTSNAYDAFIWASELGFEYKDEVATGAGSLYPRTHYLVKPMGTGYISAYLENLEKMGAEIIYNTEVKELIVEDDAVVGAKGVDVSGNAYTFNAKNAVILSTGGFAGNPELVQQYNTSGKWPDLSQRKSSNLPAIKGDGIKLGEDAGAAFRDMDQIQLLFSCNAKTGIATNANFKPKGQEATIFVNKEGERFVREDGRRDEISLAMMAQTDGVAYMIQCADSGVTEDTTDLSGVPVKDLIEMGSVYYGETLEEACKEAGLPADVVAQTVADFNKLVDEKAEEDEFGRAMFPIKFENGPWYITTHAPSIHHTMGGVIINEQCQVLNESGTPITGFYAAGEVVGGIHGANRLGGNAIVDTVVFGKLAGEEAAKLP